MASENLTKSRVESFTYRGGWDVRWDGKVTGFGVRIFPSGKKSFVYSYRQGGRKRLLTLGAFGKLTTDEARDLAIKEAARVLDGHDPVEARRAARLGETLEDLKTHYIDHLKAHGRKTWEAVERRLDRHLPSRLLSRKVSDIKRSEIAELIRKIGDQTPVNANRTLESLRSMFNLAKTWGMLDEMVPNPAERLTRYKETRRKRFVLPDELPKLARAIDQDPNLYRRALLWLLLLTGARRGELQNAKWPQVQWESKRLILPETKSGEEQFIPLSNEAVAILQAVPKVEGNPYVFPGDNRRRNGPKPLANLSAPWKEICKRAGLENLRIHDLRRTVGSYMSQSGVDLNVIKAGLRHASISTTLIYAHLGDDPARKAMDDHGKQIFGLTGRVREA